MGHMGFRLCLAVTCHDPLGAFEDGIHDAHGLWSRVDAVVVNATGETHPRTFDALAAKSPKGVVSRHRAGSIGIGAARREALRMAVSTDCTHVLYSDLDHVLRWAGSDADELFSAATPSEGFDCTVIGRSASAFTSEPARLRATESVVNEAARLAVGTLEPDCDFMMAVRLMTAGAARELVERCKEDTIGNDVAWPLHLLQAGMRLKFRAVEGLAYRHRDDFGAARDDRDSDPREWVKRIEIAAQHAAAMRPYLDARAGTWTSNEPPGPMP